jgi:hypothetical protein
MVDGRNAALVMNVAHEIADDESRTAASFGQIRSPHSEIRNQYPPACRMEPPNRQFYGTQAVSSTA